jgi:pimeloyl-ACP methyl ester carboxylesterase
MRPFRPSAHPLPYFEVGAGRPLVVMQGFGTLPQTYRSAALLLGRQCRVVVPDLFGPGDPGSGGSGSGGSGSGGSGSGGGWGAAEVLDRFDALLDHLGIDRASMIAHSFGGGLQLELAAQRPDRVADLVFVDTLAMSREWSLARETAAHPFRLLWMATPRAARDFALAVGRHPAHMAQAAWWGFVSDRSVATRAVREAGITCHVLWASRDSLLSRRDGKSFAEDLEASFAVVRSPLGHPIDHDWMYRHPWLLQEKVEQLKLWALQGES